MNEEQEINIREALESEGLPVTPENIALAAKTKKRVDAAIERLESGERLQDIIAEEAEPVIKKAQSAKLN